MILSLFSVTLDVTTVELMFLKTIYEIVKLDSYIFKISKRFLFACVFRSF